MAQVCQWNGYVLKQYRPPELVDFYESTLRPFAMYRDQEDPRDWDDFEQKTGKWGTAFGTGNVNDADDLQEEAECSKPRTAGRATKARNR